MPTSGGIIPFTELMERVKNEELRDLAIDTQAEDKYKSVVNDTIVYGYLPNLNSMPIKRMLPLLLWQIILPAL